MIVKGTEIGFWFRTSACLVHKNNINLAHLGNFKKPNTLKASIYLPAAAATTSLRRTVTLVSLMEYALF
jgi:hypothetical protein